MTETTCDLRSARKVFSRIGFALAAITVIAPVAQLLWVMIPRWLIGEENWFTGSSWGKWLGSIVSMYLLAIPAAVLILGKLPKEKPREHPLGGGNAFVIFTIMLFMTYAGNIIGTALSFVLSGGTAQNAVVEIASDHNPLKYLYMVIMAPVVEELLCRKLIIDRTRQYGEKLAVFLSGLTFGLLHQNLFQFFYAFCGGMLFGYVYLRTGRIRYTILLHGVVNFMGGVLAPLIVSLMENAYVMDPAIQTDAELMAALSTLPGALLGMLVSYLYVLALMGLSVTGLVMLIIKSRRLIWYPATRQLPRGTAAKTVYLNVGMILYILLCAASMVLELL